MNLLFWNLHRKDNQKYIMELIAEHDIDFCIFAEHDGIDFASLETEMNHSFTLHEGFGGCDKIRLFAKTSLSVAVRREQNRYTLYSVSVGNDTYIIAGIHLSANPYANSEMRKNEIRDIVRDVEALEKEFKNKKTIIIGDFNASPFDEELIQKDTFNAVIYKDLIEKAEYVTIGRKRYHRFYNPIVNYITEENRNYGSFYYGNGMDTLYWYCYDQILVRKGLVNAISDVRYCRETTNGSLISDIKPNEQISDHLPLIVKMEGSL